MIPDRLQYFLDDFWNFENLYFSLTFTPPFYHHLFLKIQENHGNISETYYLFKAPLSGNPKNLQIWTHRPRNKINVVVLEFGIPPKKKKDRV